MRPNQRERAAIDANIAHFLTVKMRGKAIFAYDIARLNHISPESAKDSLLRLRANGQVMEVSPGRASTTAWRSAV